VLHIAEDEPGDIFDAVTAAATSRRSRWKPLKTSTGSSTSGGRERADLHVSIHDAGRSVTAWKSGGCCSAASTRVSISRSARLGGRVHPQIAWTKLDTLVKGAELASSQLWG
jgi:hypothetical protein